MERPDKLWSEFVYHHRAYNDNNMNNCIRNSTNYHRDHDCRDRRCRSPNQSYYDRRRNNRVQSCNRSFHDRMPWHRLWSWKYVVPRMVGMHIIFRSFYLSWYKMEWKVFLGVFEVAENEYDISFGPGNTWCLGWRACVSSSRVFIHLGIQ